MEKIQVIGITGGSGSGKTSFIKGIRDRFSESQVCILSQDNYYHPREMQKTDSQGVKNFDLPEAIDQTRFLSDLKKLINKEPVEIQEYVFNNELKRASILTFVPAPVVVVEGLFIFSNREIFDLIDLSILIHAKENVKVIRRIKRDQIERNYPLEDVMYRCEHHVSPSYDTFIRPFQEEVNLIINNNKTFQKGLEVVSAYIKQHIY